MTSIILCPGESLNAYEPHVADLIIGVNRAALKFECHVFAALDYPTIRDNESKVLGNPNLLSRLQTVADLRGRLGRFPEIFVIEDLPTPPLSYVNTAIAALLYAAHVGATKIQVYGADWSGTKDYDGKEAGEDRTETRWNKEREAWDDALVPWLAERGIAVERKETDDIRDRGE